MNTASPSLKFVFHLAKLQSLLMRKFDGSLGGLGFNEFIILYSLAHAHEEKLRRIDLAGKLGLTASGITRILLPMEKVGLVKKEVNPYDARVSYVLLAPGGKRKLEEGLERAEFLVKEIVPNQKKERMSELCEILKDLSGTVQQ